MGKGNDLIEENGEICFSYNEERCHAKIVSRRPEEEMFIGSFGEYDIYQIPCTIFDQFGFIATKEKAQSP